MLTGKFKSQPLNFEQYLHPHHLLRKPWYGSSPLWWLCQTVWQMEESSECLARVEASRENRPVWVLLCLHGCREAEGWSLPRHWMWLQTVLRFHHLSFDRVHSPSHTWEPLILNFSPLLLENLWILRQLKGIRVWALLGVWAPSRCEWGCLQGSPIGKVFPSGF